MWYHGWRLLRLTTSQRQWKISCSCFAAMIWVCLDSQLRIEDQKGKPRCLHYFIFFAYSFGSVAFFAFDGTVPQSLLCVWGLRSPRHTFQTLQLVPYWVAWTRTSQMSVVNLCRGCEQRQEFQRQRYLADSTNIMCEHINIIYIYICTFSLASCSSDGASIFLLHLFFRGSSQPTVVLFLFLVPEYTSSHWQLARGSHGVSAYRYGLHKTGFGHCFIAAPGTAIRHLHFFARDRKFYVITDPHLFL